METEMITSLGLLGIPATVCTMDMKARGNHMMMIKRMIKIPPKIISIIILQGRVTITPNNFWNDGCYRPFLTCLFVIFRVMGVIGVNGALFPLVKIDFLAIFQKKLPNF